MPIKPKSMRIALDPLKESPEHLSRMKEFANLMGQTGSWETQSLTMASLDSENEAEALRELVSRKALEAGHSMGLNPGSVKLVFQKFNSSHQMAKVFCRTVEEERGDLILLHTRTSSVLKSSLGSFATALLHSSRVPVAVLPLEAKVPQNVRTILYPTDFSSKSGIAFKTALDIAAAWGAKIVLFHRSAGWRDEILQTGIETLKTERSRISQEVALEESSLLESSEAWKFKGAVAQVPVQIEFSRERMMLGGSILAAAQKFSADFIVLPTQTASLDVPSLGSTAAEVARKASCPVLILPVSYCPLIKN